MSMQEKILFSIKDNLAQRGLECVIQKDYSNNGTLYVMRNLDVLCAVSYNFQTDSASLQVIKNGANVNMVMGPNTSERISFYITYNKNLKEKFEKLMETIKTFIV